MEAKPFGNIVVGGSWRVKNAVRKYTQIANKVFLTYGTKDTNRLLGDMFPREIIELRRWYMFRFVKIIFDLIIICTVLFTFFNLISILKGQ